MDKVTEISLNTLEDNMKRGVLMAWYYTRDFSSDSNKVTQLCKTYGYELHQISYNPETMQNRVVFEKSGGVTNEH